MIPKSNFNQKIAILFLLVSCVWLLYVAFDWNSGGGGKSSEFGPSSKHQTDNREVVPHTEEGAGDRTNESEVSGLVCRLGPEVDLESAWAKLSPIAASNKNLPANEVYRRFQTGGLDWEALRRLHKGDIVTFPLPEGTQARGVVNLVDTRPGEPFGIGGELVSGIQGSFSLVQDPIAGVRGLLLPSQGEVAYRFKEENGEVYFDELPKGSVICLGMPAGPKPPPALRTAAVNPAIPQLESLSNAVATLYLDFDGESVTDPSWNSGKTIDALPPVFTNAVSVTKIWQEVSEDFIPFNVNVTTIAARYSSAPSGKRMRAIVTPTKTAATNAGGVAILNSFTNSGTTPCWVFNGAGDLDSEFNSHMCAMSISHELGHTFGLRHDGLKPAAPTDGVGSDKKEPYYIGHSTTTGGWGPIMGAPFSYPTVQWSQDAYYGKHHSDPQDSVYYQGNNSEDDIGIIGTVAGYRSDDYADTPGNCALIPQGALTNGVRTISLSNGLIGAKADKTKDVDFFRVECQTGSAITIQASNSPKYPNLKLRLTLLNGDLTTNIMSDPPNLLTASINLLNSQSNKVYFLKVEGVGTTLNTNTTDGFVNYGSLGQYALVGSIKNPPYQPGDNFADAITTLGNGFTPFTMLNYNKDASLEVGEPKHANMEGGKSVWWSWAAPANGKLELSTAGSSFDTLLAVYTGNTVNALQLVGSNDDVSKIDVTSKLIVSNIIAGTQYRIAVDGYRGASGSIKLSGKFTEMVVLPPPSNVVATQDKSGRVQVSWAVLPGAITYDLQINAGTKVVGSWRGATNNVKTIGALSKSISLTVNVRGNAAGNQPGVWSGAVPVVK